MSKVNTFLLYKYFVLFINKFMIYPFSKVWFFQKYENFETF